MATPNEKIDELLANLEDENAYQRLAAIEELEKVGSPDPRILVAITKVAQEDRNQQVATAARQALRASAHQNLPDGQKRDAPSTTFSLQSTAIGGVTGALCFIPATIVAYYVLDFVLFDLLTYRSNGDPDDFMVVIFCWLPAVFLGMIGGLFGGEFGRKRNGKAGSILGALSGGVLASLIVAFLMTWFVFNSSLIPPSQPRVTPTVDRPLQTRVATQAQWVDSIPLLKGESKLLTTIPGVFAQAVSPDGRILAATTNDSIVLWDIEQNQELNRIFLNTSEILPALFFSPDGHLLLSGDYDYNLIAWSIPEGKQIFKTKMEGHQAYIRKEVVSPDGQWVASGDKDGQVLLWDVSKNRELSRLDIGAARNNSMGRIQDLEFNPDSQLLALSCIGPDEIVLYNVSQQQVVGRLNGFGQYISFSPDGSLLAGKTSQGVAVWDVDTFSLLGETKEISPDSEIRFSPDGHQFTLTHGENIFIYNTATLKPVGRLRNQDAYTVKVIFLPNGQLLAGCLGPQGLQLRLWTTNFE